MTTCDAYPGVIRRDGETDPRDGLIGGPDVREVISALLSARTAEPDLDDAEIVALLERNAGVPAQLFVVAVAYWANHPTEIDHWLASADATEDALYAEWTRAQSLERH